MSVTCEHSMKARKEGLCAKCADIKPYTVFRVCKDECFACKQDGYFWGPSAPEDKVGKPMYKDGNPQNE